MSSTRLTMSLDDSISKRKTEERGGRRGGKPFASRVSGFGKRRFDKSYPRFSSRRGGFRGGRARRDFGDRRERPERGSDETKDKFEGRSRPRAGEAKFASKFIKRTGTGTRTARFTSERKESRPFSKEMPVSERRRLRVSNLDFNITHKDLMELFSKLGSLTKNKLEHDDLGRSKGTAVIEYEKHDSAVKAIEEYDGAVLDGRTITVEYEDDAKRRGGSGGESRLQKKVINKDYPSRERRYEGDREERRGRDRDRDREDKDDDDDEERPFRGRRGFRSSRGFRGSRGGGRDFDRPWRGSRRFRRDY